MFHYWSTNWPTSTQHTLVSITKPCTYTGISSFRNYKHVTLALHNYGMHKKRSISTLTTNPPTADYSDGQAPYITLMKGAS